MAATQTGSTHISACGQLRNEIPRSKTMFPGLGNLLTSLPIVSYVSGSRYSRWRPLKPEVHISQLVNNFNLETKFQAALASVVVISLRKRISPISYWRPCIHPMYFRFRWSPYWISSFRFHDATFYVLLLNCPYQETYYLHLKPRFYHV